MINENFTFSSVTYLDIELKFFIFTFFWNKKKKKNQ